MGIYLTVDFGSTYTKLTAIDMAKEKILGTSKSFTTIETDVRDGYNKALALLKAELGEFETEKVLASSSAAGGLKMVSVGLVPDLTVKASKLAATSAGAKLYKTYAYELTKSDVREIEEIQPDIILISGGTDGGNKQVVSKNAELLSDLQWDCLFVYSGNKSLSDDIQELYESKEKRIVICENVMPKFGQLNIEPTKSAIRDLFIKNIVSAKGLDEAQKFIDNEIVPTPLAVFDIALLLSKGCEEERGIGELMLYDIGGATTDVYSMADGSPKDDNVYYHGLYEPYDKRSVEGDIGMRYSAKSLVEEATVNKIARDSGVSVEEVITWVETCRNTPDVLPETEIQFKIETALAKNAVEICSKRHCGTYEITFTVAGEAKVQEGKDLTKVTTIIGTGGSIINSTFPDEILSRAVYTNSDLNSLKPANASFYIDKKNILAGMGLLSAYDPKLALRIMKSELINL